MKNNRSNITIENGIRVIRKTRSLSQQELGERAGISRQSVNAIEKMRYMPTIKTALLLAGALQCGLEELFWIKTGGIEAKIGKENQNLPENPP